MQNNIPTYAFRYMTVSHFYDDIKNSQQANSVTITNKRNILAFIRINLYFNYLIVSGSFFFFSYLQINTVTLGVTME